MLRRFSQLQSLMPWRSHQPLTEEPSLKTKAQRLIFGRVGFVLFLLMANLWRASGNADLTGADGPDGLVIAFAVTASLAVIYLFTIRFAPRLLDQLRIQFVIDLALITWLVWQTGDIISPYVTLYIVLISVAGFFFGKAETLYFAIACAVAFGTLSGLTGQDILASGSGDQPPSRILQIVGVNVVAILLVGLLAARLSERRRLSEDLKYAEEMFANLNLLHERIVESIGTGLITTDLVGRIYAFNRSAADITGIRTADAIGNNIFDIFGSDIRERVGHLLDPDNLREFDAVHFEWEFPRDDSDNVAVMCSIVPLTGRSGKTNGLIMTFQDVTHMRELEQTVRRSDRLAAVGRMAAGLAHEIRNPLGSMSSALQFLQERAGAQTDDSKLMDVVLRESDRMNTIITNFLAYARPAPNGSGTHRDEVDVSAALADCIALIKHSPEVSTDHEFELELPDRPAKILADETQLKQVFWNLSRNAIQAMPDGGRLNIRLTHAPGNRLLIEFADTGKGMSDDFLKHIFEPFISGSGGTGLGLSIVYKIVSDHGGTIDIQSSPGEGTRISMVFRAVVIDDI
jgi:two-component system sensor histidine kinase PilS (NtrC family)